MSKLMRVVFRGPFDDFRRIVTCIASAIAGHDVTLRRIAYEPLPDRDCFGGTHSETLEDTDVRVVEDIGSNEEGSSREGYGYSMRWEFVGTGPREGAKATIVGGGMQPKLDEIDVNVTASEFESVRAALTALLGKHADRTDEAWVAQSNIEATLGAGEATTARVLYERVMARATPEDRSGPTFLALEARMARESGS